MICYECAKSGKRSEAVGLCHHCSAALCSDHAIAIDDAVTALDAVCKAVVLPKHARLILCATCQLALAQSHPAHTTANRERL